MFLRVKKFGRNKQRKYYYIVRTIKIKGKPKQKVVKYLGAIEDILKMVNENDKISKKSNPLSNKSNN